MKGYSVRGGSKIAKMRKRAIPAIIVLVVLAVLGSVIGGCAGAGTPRDTTIIDLPSWVSPDQGTIGTEFTITGSGFGDSKPGVRVEEAECTVLSWSDTAIRAVLADTLAPGTYDVTIEPGEREAALIVVQESFTVMPPSIDPLIPLRVDSVDEMTIRGSFFGSELGKVFAVDQSGQAENCRLLEWSMESITFALPQELSEVYDLVVQNDVGAASQTRVLIGGAPPTQTRDYEPYILDATSPVTGISYGGEFWAFWSGAHGFSRVHVVQYSRLGPAGKKNEDSWYAEKHSPFALLDSGGKVQLSRYAPSPVVFKANLFVFWVDKKTSAIKYSLYLGQDKVTKEDQWDGPHTIAIGVTPSGEVSPVYNPKYDRLELYYMSGSKIYWLHTADGTKWFNRGAIAGVQTSSPVTAEAVETGENEFQIMLAARSPKDEIQIIFTLDGKVTRSFPLKNVYDPKENEHTYVRPFLTNLGHGEVALLWRGTENRVNVVYYNEKTQTFHDKQTFPQYPPDWGSRTHYPTGAVGFDVRDDALLAHFWVFYDDYEGVNTRDYKYLGMWKHSRTEGYDWAQVQGKEVWDLYPVIGVIDMPPFVTNGHTTAEVNKTKTDFQHEATRATSMDISLQAGAYFKKEAELGVNAEVHAGLTEQWSKEKTVSTGIQYSLEAHAAPKIRVLYLAPVLQMIEYQWHDASYQGTEDVMVVPVVTGASILARLVDPSTDPNFQIPVHQAGNLDTYGTVLDHSLYDISASATWDVGGPTVIRLVQEEKQVKGTGGYFEFKIGYNFAKLVGFGAEGKFEIKHTSSTTVTDSVAVILDNPPPSVEGDIQSFVTTVYWAKPNKNGYWVPQNRRGLGDDPWFMTYTVGQVIPYQP